MNPRCVCVVVELLSRRDIREGSGIADILLTFVSVFSVSTQVL